MDIISLKESIEQVVGAKAVSEDGDNPENESQYTSLVNNIRDSFYSNFPNGFFNATESKRFSHSIAISFGMIKNLDDVANKIRENDPMLGRIFIWLSTAPDYKVELSVGGLSLNPDPGTHYAMKHLKFPWRNFKTTDLVKIENQFKVFFSKLKDTVKANQDNIYQADRIPKQYFVESNVTEGVEESLTGNSNPTVNLGLIDMLGSSKLIAKYPGAIRISPIAKNKFTLTLEDQSLINKDPLIAKLFSKGGSQVSESDSSSIPAGYENPKEVFSNESGKVVETLKGGKSYFFSVLSDGTIMGNGRPISSKTVAVSLLKAVSRSKQ